MKNVTLNYVETEIQFFKLSWHNHLQLISKIHQENVVFVFKVKLTRSRRKAETIESKFTKFTIFTVMVNITLEEGMAIIININIMWFRTENIIEWEAEKNQQSKELPSEAVWGMRQHRKGISRYFELLTKSSRESEKTFLLFST